MSENNRHPSQRHYPPELRGRAVRLVRVWIAETGERWRTVTDSRTLAPTFGLAGRGCGA
jgi:hypothetical protein